MTLKLKLAALVTAVAFGLTSCAPAPEPAPSAPSSWVDQAVIYEVNIRQYTPQGTFNAFAENLPRLKALGVDVLWFMPITPISKKNRKGTLGSPYSVANYTEVNADYGTKADFKALVDKAHQMGFKVVLDWVANHTGWDNPWITEHPDWYTKDTSGNITWPAGTDWTDVADLNYDNQAMRAEMIKSMKYWVTDFDIDGFRCDVAGEVPADFWETAKAELETVKPMWMLAENSDQMALLKTFNANYGWPLQAMMKSLANDSFDADLIQSQVESIYSSYLKGTYPMIFITNHDENAWNGTEFMRYGDAADSLAVFEFTMPGMPLIYSGQEVGFNKRLPFFEKSQIDWQDPKNYTAFYQKLISLKDSNPALWTGSAGGNWRYLPSDYPSFIAYARTLGTNKVVVVMSFTQLAKSAKVQLADLAGDYTNWQSGEKVHLDNNTEFSFDGVGYQVFLQGSN